MGYHYPCNFFERSLLAWYRTFTIHYDLTAVLLLYPYHFLWKDT